jgi:hypothetical protein
MREATLEEKSRITQVIKLYRRILFLEVPQPLWMVGFSCAWTFVCDCQVWNLCNLLNENSDRNIFYFTIWSLSLLGSWQRAPKSFSFTDERIIFCFNEFPLGGTYIVRMKAGLQKDQCIIWCLRFQHHLSSFWQGKGLEPLVSDFISHAYRIKPSLKLNPGFREFLGWWTIQVLGR